MKYELTKREKQMLSLERSYRNERAGAGAFALITGVPLLVYAIFILYYRLRFPEAATLVPINWDIFRNAGLYFMIPFFLAYRAHTKLQMIEHLKHHISEKDKNSEPASSDYRATRSV
ncbi:MAG: hypothetical protein WC381_11555 [Kiritimatiellia bacterium]|jgi:hypothetical protein